MYKKLNYATGVLSAGISDSATEVVLKAGHTITTETGEANKFVGVFFDKTKSSPFQDINREIVEAYRTDTNKFTIARAKEGTSAKSWVEDDNFMLIASSAVFDEYEEELGYKENLANKKTTITDSDTDYLTSRAVKTAVEAREPLLTKGNLSGSGVITIDNTRQVIGGAATISHTDSATVRHVTDTEKATWNAKQNALGYTPENVANKRTSFQTTPTDTAYISEKLAKDSLDTKAPIVSPTFTTSITGSYLTASEILITDANKKIVSAPVATYPSLTELTYVKGVTSGIQSQLNNKQNTLGFTPENVANKKTTITDSDTDYLTSRAVKTAVEAREPLLTKGNLSGSGVITIDNTRQVIGGAATISHTDSATVRHVTDTEKATWNAKQNALGYTPENVANKRTSFQATPTDTAYISEKLAKDSLDAKENLANKKTTITDSDDDYPTCKAVKTAVDAKMANPMTTQGDIIYGGSSGTPTRLSKGTAGQVLTMNSGATTPEWSTPKGISWSIVTDDTTMNVDTGSLANKETLLVLTLPSTSAVGKTVRVAGMNTGLWKIAQASNQYIKFGNLSTTTGTGGSLSSTQAYDAVELVCIEANKGWVVVSSIGNITVV